MTIKSRVSICIPTCNRPDLLLQCIESCLAQTHADIEILIGDDSPDDRTERLIAGRYGHATRRLAYRRNRPSLGQTRNVASLFARASGDKILLIHDDDYLAPTGVERLLAQWEHHPDLEVAFGNQYLVSPDGQVDLAASQRLNRLFHREPAAAGLQPLPGRTGIVQMFPNNGWLANAALVKQIDYVTDYDVCCDFVFGVRLCLAARSVCYIDEYVSYYRKTAVSVSQATRHTTNASSLAAWRFLKEISVPPELEPARAVALRRVAPIVVSLYARNHDARAALQILLGSLDAYRFGLSPRLYYHLLMLCKSAWRSRKQAPALAPGANGQVSGSAGKRIS